MLAILNILVPINFLGLKSDGYVSNTLTQFATFEYAFLYLFTRVNSLSKAIKLIILKVTYLILVFKYLSSKLQYTHLEETLLYAELQDLRVVDNDLPTHSVYILSVLRQLALQYNCAFFVKDYVG